MAKHLSNLDLVKNELQNARIQNLAAPPSSPVLGQVYFQVPEMELRVWVGSVWRPLDAFNLHDGSISNDALATDPLARANHTGTQLANTISNFDTQVRTSRVDQLAAPTAALAMNSQKITGLAAGTAGSTDAARMVDLDTAMQSAAAGIDSKPSVRAVATANVALTGLQTIDGVSLIATNRVLLTGQTTASQNGVYVVAAGAWTRATDADATGEITPGAFWFVEEGTSYGASQWRCANTGTITVGTTSITISQFGQAQTFVGGDGLTLTGNVFAVGAGTGITVAADSVAIDTSVVARKYSANIGNNSLTSIPVTHGLGTQDIVVAVKEVATNAHVYCDIVNTDANTVTLLFAVAPSTNQYRVTVIG